MTTGSVTTGRAESGVMVNGPAPAILKLIVSGTLTLALAGRMAWRREPAPLSLMLVTARLAARAWPIPTPASKVAKAMVRRAGRVNRTAAESKNCGTKSLAKGVVFMAQRIKLFWGKSEHLPFLHWPFLH